MDVSNVSVGISSIDPSWRQRPSNVCKCHDTPCRRNPPTTTSHVRSLITKRPTAKRPQVPRPEQATPGTPGMKAVSIGGEGAAGTWPLGAFCQRAQVPPAFRNQPPTTTRTQPPTAPLRQSLPGASWGPEVTFQWPVQPKLRANPAKGRQLLVALALSTKPSRPQISKHPAGKPSPRSPFLLSRSSLSAARVFPSLRRHLHFDFVSLHLPDCAS